MRWALEGRRGVGGNGKVACCSASKRNSSVAIPGRLDHLTEYLKRLTWWTRSEEIKVDR